MKEHGLKVTAHLLMEGLYGTLKNIYKNSMVF